MKFLNKLVLLCFILLGTERSYAVPENLYTEFGFRYAKMIPNSNEYATFTPAALGFDFRLGTQTNGTQRWQSYHHYPRYGVGLRTLYFDERILQSKYALFGFMEAPFSVGKRFSLNYQIGLGVSFYTNPFDEQLNPDNIWIGSMINLYATLALGMNYQLTPHLDLTATTSFSHSSNGTLKQPNLGVNMFSQSLGLRYRLQPFKPAYTSDSLPPLPDYKRNNFVISLASGLKESRQSQLYYYAGTLGLSYENRFHPFFVWGMGLDICYNPSVSVFRPETMPKSQMDYFAPAAKASFEILYGRVSFYVAFGVYLHKSYPYYDPFYERAGIRCYLDKSQKHFIGGFVKAHSGSVDFLEFTYGYRFATF